MNTPLPLRFPEPSPRPLSHDSRVSATLRGDKASFVARFSIGPWTTFLAPGRLPAARPMRLLEFQDTTVVDGENVPLPRLERQSPTRATATICTDVQMKYFCQQKSCCG